LEVSYRSSVGGPELLYDTLEDELGTGTVERIDIYEEYPETLADT